MKKTVGDNLRIYRLRSNLTMSEAGKLLNVSAPAILKYEKNKIIASLERLDEFAKIYNTTIDELLDIEDKIDIKFNNIKFESNTPQIKKDKVKNLIYKKVDNYFALLNLSNKIFQNKFGVHIIKSKEEAESLATKLRIYFTIPIDAPISNLIYLLEQHEMMVITIPQNKETKGFLGFYEIVNNVPIIAVPEANNGYEQRFMIAKFLGELLILAEYHKDIFTTIFALSLLIPKESLYEAFDSKRVKIEFKEIEIYSNIYKVSYKHIIRRLLDTGIITASNAKYTSIFVNKNNKKELELVEEPYNYDHMLYKLYAEGIIKDMKKY
jgi:transcriptional regulator with XRE-family HTH domain/Zn-dependent peptidase ImmA (M78 family)